MLFDISASSSAHQSGQVANEDFTDAMLPLVDFDESFFLSPRKNL